MSTLEKMKVLGDGGAHDLCNRDACSTTMHNSLLSTVYPAVTGNGKCINLFKTLMTNNCPYDCKYCINRQGCARKKMSYEPRELVKAFLNMKRLGYVQGLFLSSAIGRDPDKTMTKMIRSVELLRKHFKGYIHLKILPGTDHYLIQRACVLADRVSINVETTPDHLTNLSGDKDYKGIMKRFNWIKREENNLPAGYTTQLIIGSDEETDVEVVKFVSRLYDSLKLRRVYYSTFTPLKGTPLESKPGINPARSHRLYQTDYLLREYGFELEELVFNNDFLKLTHDPKLLAAINNESLPLDINKASRKELLRVPGIGPVTAKKVLSEQPFNSVKELSKTGVILSRARPFIVINGQKQARLSDYPIN